MSNDAATLSDLQTQYRNAVLTCYDAGGHGKAHANELRALDLKQKIKDLGGVVPENEDCFEKGVFNGPGSV